MGKSDTCFEKMIDYKIALNVVTFNVVLNALCEKWMVFDALDHMEIMVSRGIKTNIVT